MHENPALFPGQRFITPILRALFSPFMGSRVHVMKGGLAQGLKRRGFNLGNPPLTKEERFLLKQDLEAYTVYDLGVGNGIHTLFFARAVGPQGRVIAIEPNAETLAEARESVELNGFANVELVETALGNASSTTVTTLDDAIAQRNLPAPNFIRIDVAGAEGDVLEGMAATIEAHKPELFIEMHGDTEDARLANAKRIVEFLHERGYKIYHIEWDRYAVPTNFERARDGHIWCSPPGWKRRRRRNSSGEKDIAE